MGPIVAVQFKLRGKNLGTVTAPHAVTDWHQVMVQAYSWKDVIPTGLGYSFLMIEPFHDGPDKSGAAARRGSATLEVSDFTLLSLPK